MATGAGDGTSKSDGKSKCRKQSLVCVEQLLEEDISSSQLILAADVLSRDQYNDVVDERNIIGLCGYPLCPHKLGPIPTQRYRINVKRKQILDITERKKYCSDQCYKSSQYFGHQLPSEPLWTRPHQQTLEKAIVKLLPHRLDSDGHSNPVIANQHTTTEQSHTRDTSFKKDAQTNIGDEASVHAGTQCTVNNDQDCEDGERDVASTVEENSSKPMDSFTKISRAFSTWLVHSSQCDAPSTVGLEETGVTEGSADCAVFLPAVHSVHRNQLQWSIFRRQLVGSLPKVCAGLEISLSEAQHTLMDLTSQFQLDRHSIMFRPSEWTVILLLLLIRCGMVSENVVDEQPVVSEWIKAAHMTHSHLQQLLAMLATLQLT